MQSLSKFNLNGGLKRIVSTLICVMMVLATFPMHMLKNTVSAAGGNPINLTLGATAQDGSEVSSWMNGDLGENEMTGKGDINIELSNGIEVAGTADPLPTMTATTTDPNAVSYLFDFTDGRFAGKTITIDGKGKTIKIGNKDLFFLNLKNCKVILKNIVIDGGWLGFDENWSDNGGIKRDGPFINVAGSEGDNSSELEIGEGTTIQNCEYLRNGGSHDSGGAVYSEGQLTINGGNITNCAMCSGSYAYAGKGGAISSRGQLTINDGSINNCASYSDVNVTYGGAISSSGQLTINGGNITSCTSYTLHDSSYGGAVYSEGQLTINGGIIERCGVYARKVDGNSMSGGGAVYSSRQLTINGGSITDCTVSVVSSEGRPVGGAISNFGQLTINSGIIERCSVSGGDPKGDAIFNGYSNAKLYLPSTDSGFLTIALPSEHGSECGHNSPLEAPLNYVGICNSGGTVGEIVKIEFFDSESKPLDGSVFGKTGDEISVPDSVPNRSGYKFALSYINNNNNNEKTPIDVSDDGKFTLTQGMLDVANANKGVLRVSVNYVKLYTEQYVNHGEFVGIIRAKRA